MKNNFENLEIELLKEIVNNLEINTTSSLTGKILYWDISKQEFIPPSLVFNKFGNVIFVKDFDMDLHKIVFINKSIRPVYVYLETLNLCHYCGVEGIFKKNKFYTNTNIENFYSEYNIINSFGLNFPFKQYDLGILPSKDATIFLGNHLKIDRDLFYNFLENNSDYCLLSKPANIEDQIRILWKISNAINNSSDFIVSQLVNPNILNMQIKQKYYDNGEINFHISIGTIEHLSTIWAKSRKKNNSNDVTPNKNINFYINKIKNNNTKEWMLNNLLIDYCTINLQIFSLLKEKIENFNLDNNDKKYKWFNEIFSSKKIIDVNNQNLINNESQNLLKFYEKWSKIVEPKNLKKFDEMGNEIITPTNKTNEKEK